MNKKWGTDKEDKTSNTKLIRIQQPKLTQEVFKFSVNQKSKMNKKSLTAVLMMIIVACHWIKPTQCKPIFKNLGTVHKLTQQQTSANRMGSLLKKKALAQKPSSTYGYSSYVYCYTKTIFITRKVCYKGKCVPAAYTRQVNTCTGVWLYATTNLKLTWLK